MIYIFAAIGIIATIGVICCVISAAIINWLEKSEDEEWEWDDLDDYDDDNLIR